MENKNNASRDDSGSSSHKYRSKTRGMKRKRQSSDSSTDLDDVLPENTLEVEKNLQELAVKNNLDEASVKKIIKKVVTNDHVLALVKLQEEEEEAMEAKEGVLVPKLTRSKVKELKKVSSGKPAWNLENLELTPIKHIPVKTRPEVKALIAQELPEDEDDDEYEPNHDDVQSDDDQTLESCSDLDSQPRTPATPNRQLRTSSPRVIKDGPFKVPQELTPARRKLDLEEEATIALRTRSKLCLSETPIEHIESSFVPPDDIPVQVDDLWSQFLAECLDPAPTNKNEDDDDADPEYNVAADPDAHDEDEEALGDSIIKISKKELNDLVTELFNIMPEEVDDCLAGNMADSVLSGTSQAVTRWEGKQEPQSDEEETSKISARRISDRITFEKRDSTSNSSGKIEKQERRNSTGLSIGKVEPHEEEEPTYLEIGALPEKKANIEEKIYEVIIEPINTEVPQQPEGEKGNLVNKIERLITDTVDESRDQPASRPVLVKKPISLVPSMVKVVNGQAKVVNIVMGEQTILVPVPSAPAPLRGTNQMVATQPRLTRVEVHMNSERCILPEQIIILQQQLRQHIQLAASNFMQLFVHPLNYGFGPTYKGFIESLMKIADKTPNSVADVCNLRPAMELIRDWEKKVSENTPENTEYIQFIQDDCKKWAQYMSRNNYFTGEFHVIFKKAIASSNVFLYPFLLPPRPYHNRMRRSAYLLSEDELIALGMEQFWQYVVDNPEIYPKPKFKHPRYRWWLNATLDLIAKHMLPFLTYRMLVSHVTNVRKLQDVDNPIYKFLATREIKPVEHRILPFNPLMTLCNHPVDEMPRIWLRYLTKIDKKFKKYLKRHKNQAGAAPIGIPVKVNLDPNAAIMKAPLPVDFTKIVKNKKKDQTNITMPTRSRAKDKLVTPEQNPTKVQPNTSISSASVYAVDNAGNTTKLVPLIIQVQPAKNTILPVNVPTTTDNTNTQPALIDLTDEPEIKKVATMTPNNVPTIDTIKSSTTTVNCNNYPITSTRSIPVEMEISDDETNTNESTAPSLPQSVNGHCNCCILLKKVCKRQTKITEYFSNKEKKGCFCKESRHPRITKKLIHLVNSFKDPYRIAMESFSMKLEEARKLASHVPNSRKRQNKLIENKKHEIEDSRSTDVEDLSYVTGYKMKLMARLGPNINLKSKVHSIFSNFNTNCDDPQKLGESLNEVLTGLHTALFRDFLPFLTKEQAARIGRFKDYFALVCVGDLVKMVEEEIVLSEFRRAVLQKTYRILTTSKGEPTACQICTSLLPAFTKYPHLAHRVFRLFPHNLTAYDDDKKRKGERISAAVKDACDRITTYDKIRPKEQEKIPIPVATSAASTSDTSGINPRIDRDLQSDDNTNEDMDITLCNNSTQIPNTTDGRDPDDTYCSDSSQNTSVNTLCVESTQNQTDVTLCNPTQTKTVENSPQNVTLNRNLSQNESAVTPNVNSPQKTAVVNLPQNKNIMICAQNQIPVTYIVNSHQKTSIAENSTQNSNVTVCGSLPQNEPTVTQNVNSPQRSAVGNLPQNQNVMICGVLPQNETAVTQTVNSPQKTAVGNFPQNKNIMICRFVPQTDNIVTQNVNSPQKTAGTNLYQNQSIVIHGVLPQNDIVTQNVNSPQKTATGNLLQNQNMVIRGAKPQTDNIVTQNVNSPQKTAAGNLQNQNMMVRGVLPQNEKNVTQNVNSPQKRPIESLPQNQNIVIRGVLPQNNIVTQNINSPQKRPIESLPQNQNIVICGVLPQNNIVTQNVNSPQKTAIGNLPQNQNMVIRGVLPQNDNIVTQNVNSPQNSEIIRSSHLPLNKFVVTLCTNSSQRRNDVTLSGNSSLNRDQMVEISRDDSQMQVDYEADHSSSGEDEEILSEVETDRETAIKEEPMEEGEVYQMAGTDIQIIITDIKSEHDSEIESAENNPQTVKQEEPHNSESETSMAIDTDDDTIKSETTEWQRDEDKLILQVIKDNLTKEQRGDKPILEFIEDKQVIQVLAQSLTHKSTDEIRNRIIYLLQLLLLNDK